jgi:hypothetical protein
MLSLLPDELLRRVALEAGNLDVLLVCKRFKGVLRHKDRFDIALRTRKPWVVHRRLRAGRSMVMEANLWLFMSSLTPITLARLPAVTLDQVCRFGNLRLLRQELDSGRRTNPNALLISACEAGQLPVCRFLLHWILHRFLQRRGAWAPLTDALQRAAGQGHVAVCEFLLQHGAESEAAFDMALANGHLEVCLMFYRSGLVDDKRCLRLVQASPDVAPALLKFAAGRGELEVCRLCTDVDDLAMQIASEEARLQGHSHVCTWLSTYCHVVSLCWLADDGL